ncbi:hypothetical protein LL253_17965 [Sphingobium soli]|uniref:Uncharacterized protein n=2 Tax=Sphingobium soli TaxID=1591116 RepID=A0ABS8H7S6_9SPHN|nr:hypothetical protein [Sphingobium soli]
MSMIGTKTRWMTGALVSAGLLLGSVSAAEARPRWDRGWDRGWDRHHRHRGDGFGLGDAIGVAALVGAVAIVANSMSKDRKVRDPITGGEYDAPPPRAGTDYGDDLGSDAPPPPVDEADFSDIAAQDDALADSCARAARDEAERDGGFAEVRTMASPVAAANGGYNIDGQVEQRASTRAPTGQTRRFTCTLDRDGRVAQVYLSRDLVSR